VVVSDIYKGELKEEWRTTEVIGSPALHSR